MTNTKQSNQKAGECMREKEDYRAILERVNDRFPSKDMLNITDMSNFTGIDRRVLAEDVNFSRSFVKIGKSNYLSKASFVRLLCK